MKKKIIIALGLILAFEVVLYATLQYTHIDDLPAQVYTQKANASLPVTLSIPSLGIETHIESVGMTEDGNMATPRDADNVGWYKFGPVPGEKGSSVLAGHLDTLLGGDAVFARLSELKPGDDVYVTDEKGQKHRFIVVSEKLYDYTAATEEVFAETPEAHLNLITCQGDWDRSARSYDKRLVVFTKLAP